MRISPDDLVKLATIWRKHARGPGKKPYAISYASFKIFGKVTILEGLRKGETDIYHGSLVKSAKWLSAHWPPGVDWPSDIPRPK